MGCSGPEAVGKEKAQNPSQNTQPQKSPPPSNQNGGINPENAKQAEKPNSGNSFNEGLPNEIPPGSYMIKK